MKYLLLLLFSLTVICNAQEYKLAGEPIQGSVMVGTGENISEVYLDGEPVQVDKNGRFVIGLDRDEKGPKTLKIIFKDGSVKTEKLTVKKRKYKIQRLKVKSRYVNPPAEEMERIERESEIMKKARKKIGLVDSMMFDDGFIMPVEGGRITSLFGSQRILNGVPKKPHNGIDIGGVGRGAPVKAAADGIVVLAGKNFYFNGNFVLIDHGLGLNSIYLHLDKLYVTDGQKVKKGDVIGEVGSTGRSTGPHLHWGVQWYSKRIDPMSVLNLTLN
ncbi:M23 peptidase domain protein [Melioribacter roseus P3M-2]|jgi:murein DD-endopeptidase MepM/ murein hydrolase activator NlpD|uniref:M23 peptidase domain protein n=1 Tax=Melioribacter roseus (strain DSM 23840 / JCM 17771 / VKM B-2668 / P3M-2) TaxID=1191523 RepID=I7A2H4_MELRP|nr:M23 family metallopeptidase [Melioribacter roseus]AFN74131.1 M23 peptidase domain protein [Melioribacter roseus P3M-2]